MMFYVYMQPEVITVAQNGGPYAVQALISFLRGAVQNCCLVEFLDDRTRAAIRDYMDAFPAAFDRKLLKSLLSSLQKRNRFLYVLEPDYTSIRSDLEVVLAAVADLQTDLVLCESQAEITNPGTEVCELATYQNTNFAHQRFQLAGEGKTLAEGELGQQDYLDEYWSKVFRFASRIEICDHILGRQFGSNFEYSLRALFHWLEGILDNPGGCSLIMHVGVPDKASLEYIRTQLTAYKQGALLAMRIEIHTYDLDDGRPCLPHERFILTDQIAVEIGRGMDFLDSATHRIRDVSLGYKSPKEVTDLLASYAAYKQLPVTIL